MDKIIQSVYWNNYPLILKSFSYEKFEKEQVFMLPEKAATCESQALHLQEMFEGE